MKIPLSCQGPQEHNPLSYVVFVLFIAIIMNGGGDVNMKLMAKGTRRSASGSGGRPALKLAVLGGDRRRCAVRSWIVVMSDAVCFEDF